MTILHELLPCDGGGMIRNSSNGINCCTASAASSSAASLEDAIASAVLVTAANAKESTNSNSSTPKDESNKSVTTSLITNASTMMATSPTTTSPPATTLEESAASSLLKCTATDIDMDMATNFPPCPEVDLEFENVRYTVRSFSFAERKFVTKEILHGINGAFRAGELTAIMGPSGSGKSTLLNVMTGFRATGVTGTISVNGRTTSTNSARFRELSCYIHQDDLLRPQLTVSETMLLAAHLKLGFSIPKEHKLKLIKNILSLLGLEHRCNVCTIKLSGGQKKRLAIALELISNPPVLFLDEPTTGLDSSSCSQCVLLLKKLAAQGHTIVCTIHQPSALIFEMFDKLYTIVDGHCIYQGPVRELVPFLADQELICPGYHNPADFLMEVAVGEHERDLERLINAANKKYYEDVDLNQLNRVTQLISQIQENIEKKTSGASGGGVNGLKRYPTAFNSYAKWSAGVAATSAGATGGGGGDSDAECVTTDGLKSCTVDGGRVDLMEELLRLEEIKALNGGGIGGAGKKLNQKTTNTPQRLRNREDRRSFGIGRMRGASLVAATGSTTHLQGASFLMQYLLLLQRLIVCARRNYFLLLARIFSHLLIGFLFGYLYRNVGQQATTVLGNYVYLYGSTLLLVYTGKMAVVLTFPLEIDMLTREHFNRWYGLGPHFLSIISFEIPFQSICAILYMVISVYLTGNYSSDAFRMYYFILLGVMATLSAQAWGFFVGATLPIKLAVFAGPILAVLFSVFGFCTRYIDITPMLRWMWHLSYFRASFHGTLNAVYGLDRPFMPCPETAMYCHFRSPKVFLNYMMISDVHMANCVTLMAIVISVMHILTLITLWHKLNKR